MDEISCGENVFVSLRYSTCTIGFPPWSTTLNGHDSTSFLTVGSSNLRPMRRLNGQLWIRQILIEFPISYRYILDIKNGIGRVHRSLVLCRFPDQALLVGERDE